MAGTAGALSDTRHAVSTASAAGSGAVAGGVASYFLTGNRKYLRFSLLLARYAVGVALAIFALLILERVAVIPF